MTPDNLLHLFQNIRLFDFIDVAIVALLLYAFLVWFEKAASRFILIGIIILGLTYTFARFFNLYLTEYVLRGFFAILLVAMLIIFQEDLRRFFERLATWNVFRKRKSALSAPRDVEVLSRSIVTLAKKHYGALIILQGKDYLDRHLDGGTVLDGALSEPLLESLFDPHSIGHDGALIIIDGRIVKFGCHLPLSTNMAKLGQRGLRHAAGLGLSERIDALCIIVSEERGTITIARHGDLKSILSGEELMSVLNGFSKESLRENEGKSLRRRLLSNSWEKVVAVAVAISLWFAFGYQAESIRRDFVVPIAFGNLSNDWIIKEQYPKEARVTMSGAEQAFNMLNEQSLKIILNVSNIQEGRQTIPIQRDDVQHPSNLDVVSIQPGYIRITSNQLFPSDVPVKAVTSGNLPPGYVLDSIEVNPPSVTALVSKNLKRIPEIMTETINLDTVKETITIKPKLILPADILFTNSKPPEVLVTFHVVRPAEESTKPAVPGGARAPGQ
ncbi:MAG: diadenylate cyclase [Deltaproteobacteria bacterium]|nr:diadenylate cyclase [Deltaproteobacteria bacterium]